MAFINRDIVNTEKSSVTIPIDDYEKMIALLDDKVVIATIDYGEGYHKVMSTDQEKMKLYDDLMAAYDDTNKEYRKHVSQLKAELNVFKNMTVWEFLKYKRRR